MVRDDPHHVLTSERAGLAQHRLGAVVVLSLIDRERVVAIKAPARPPFLKCNSFFAKLTFVFAVRENVLPELNLHRRGGGRQLKSKT